MSCPDAEQLEYFASNRLSEDVQSSVASHVSTCRECGALVSQFRENQSVLEELARLTPDQFQRAASQPVPTDIPGFRIVQELGRGGMGVVYEAEQKEPHRRVALKVIRGGEYLTPEHARFFQREVRALARLKHPGIATIHEAGRTAAGQPFFAMELVQGTSLDRFVVERRLSKRARLELFSTICDAMNYAHQRGVIHRDLKPSNILIDEEGKSKILDFGLARITHTDTSLTTMTTEVGKIKGTLAYMSPEQARGNPDEIDLRSDVYSLGIVLYQLMTDQLPYDIKKTLIPEALRVICEEEPRRPSTISRTLRGDVETITLKALAKEPSRRYQSVATLAEDVERYLASRPIMARPPSAMYQFGKLVARHKAPSAFAAILFLLITGSGIWMSVLDRRAELEGAKATLVQEFLQDMLASIDPRIAQGRDTTILRELLDRLAVRVSQDLTRQPQIEAELYSTIGATYKSLGQYDPAEVHLRKAEAIYAREFGDKHPSTLRSKTELAYLLLTQGKREEAETLVRPTLELQRTLFGREDPDTLESTNVLSLVLWKQGQNVEAEELARQALDLRSALLGMEDPDTLKSMVILSNVRFAQKDYPEAESLRRQAMEIQLRILGEADPATLYSMSILANALFAQENYAEAEELHRQTLQIQRRIFGEDHPVILTSMHNLGLALWYQHRLTEAEEFYRQSWEGRCRVLTPQHPQTIKTLDNLVLVLGDQEKWDDARPLLRELIAHRKCAAEDANASPTAINGYARLLLTCWPVDLRDPATALREAKRAVQKGGEQNPYHLDTLSRAYEQAGDVELAIVAQQKVLELAPPGESLYRKKVEERLVSLYWVSGDLETAEKICRDLLARRHGANLDKSHPFIDNALELLGRTLMKRGKFADAEPIFRECLEIRREALPESDWRIPHTKSLLGASLAGQGSFEAAEPLIMDGYHEMERSSHVLAEHVQEALLRIVDLYKAWGKPGKAAEWRAKLPRTDEAEPVKP